MRGLGGIGFVIFLVLGLYLIVESFSLISLPAFVVSADKWISSIAGILLVVGGYYFWKQKRYAGGMGY